MKAKSYQTVAEQLAEANRSLQEAEMAVRRADRLAALGQLTAGLAHELRNPLGTIKASAEMLRKAVPAENEVAREMAGFISTEVDRTNSLVTRFLRIRPAAAGCAWRRPTSPPCSTAPSTQLERQKPPPASPSTRTTRPTSARSRSTPN